MADRRKLAPVLLALLALVLAGCSDGGDPAAAEATGDEAPEVEATSTTGGIRGIVVDDRITPIAGAGVTVRNSDKAAETGEDGTFAISGLEAGTYLIEVAHPLYSTAQQSVEVVAGVAEPRPVKVQLIRTVFAEPFFQTQKFEGFIVCSANVDGVGYSEECGEGVGLPVVGRVGKQPNNNVQFDFFISAGAESVILEQVWEPTSEAGRAFFTPVATEWLCDPFCGGNRLTTLDGPSPLTGRFEKDALPEDFLPDETIITMFTYASLDSNPIGVLLNQQFQSFVTTFYYVPAPEGWSFVGGSPDPF